MPSQVEIAEHLDLSQPVVSELMKKLGIDWSASSLSEIRTAYIRHLRAQASGHQSGDGLDLVKERVLTERVDRELKLLAVAEKKGMLVNVSQLEPELMNMVAAFRTELLARDDKLKAALDALYGTDIDLAILNDHTYSALHHLARYDAGSDGIVAQIGGASATAGATDHNGVGAAA